MYRAYPFRMDDDNDIDRTLSDTNHVLYTRIIYGIGMVIVTGLFFGLTKMNRMSNIILYITTMGVLSANMYFSSKHINEADVEYSMFRMIETNATTLFSYIATISVLSITVSRTDKFNYEFKYTMLIASTCMLATMITIWIPSDNRWINRYSRDIKTILFTLGIVFSIASLFSLVLHTGPPEIKNVYDNGTTDDNVNIFGISPPIVS